MKNKKRQRLQGSDRSPNHPTFIQRLFHRFEGEAFFQIMEKNKIFCETQYISLESTEVLEQVYMLNAAPDADMKQNTQHEANGLIMTTGGHVLGRLIPNILPYDHPGAPNLSMDSCLEREKVIKGDMISVFNYAGRTHVASKWAANGMSTCSWDEALSHYEAVRQHLSSRHKSWNDAFTWHNRYENYSWVFILTPPTDTKPDGDMVLIAAYNKQLNTEIKPYYLNLWAQQWGFSRPWAQDCGHIRADTPTELVDSGRINEPEYILVDYARRRVLVRDVVVREIEKLKKIPVVGLRRVVNLVLTLGFGQAANFLPAEFENLIFTIEDTIEDISLEADNLWDFLESLNLEPRKAFAHRALSYDLGHFMMMAYDGKIKSGEDLVRLIPRPWLTRRILEKRGEVARRELARINKRREALRHNDD